MMIMILIMMIDHVHDHDDKCRILNSKCPQTMLFVLIVFVTTIFC